MKYVKVDLTPMEADMWDWAADPTIEMWAPDNDEGRDDGLHFEEDVITFAKKVNGGTGSEGLIHPHKSVIEDMIYRLDEQLPSMSKSEFPGVEGGKGDAYTKQHMSAARTMKFAGQVVKKLRAIPIEFGL